MITPRRRLGDEGEQAAAEFLYQKGYQILARNYATRFGELDIIAKKEGGIAVVEVKTRTSVRFGTPEDALTYRKLQHLVRMTKWYMMKEKRKEERVQIDCIAIDYTKTPFEIRHIENIVGE